MFSMSRSINFIYSTTKCYFSGTGIRSRAKTSFDCLPYGGGCGFIFYLNTKAASYQKSQTCKRWETSFVQTLGFLYTLIASDNKHHDCFIVIEIAEGAFFHVPQAAFLLRDIP